MNTTEHHREVNERDDDGNILTTIAARLGLAPRWLTVLGLATGVVLLASAGFIPWFEVVFPAWVFVFSVHILVPSFRRADPTVG